MTSRPKESGAEARLGPEDAGCSPTENELFELVYRQMRALTAGREQELDDLVQDAIEQCLRSLSSFEGRSKLSTWTYQICYRTLLKRFRSRSRWLKRFTLTSTGVLPETAGPVWEGTPAQVDQIRRVRQALGALSPKKRAVVVMHDLEGLASEEIAIVTKTKLGTVRSRLRDGRKDLLHALRSDPDFGEEPEFEAGE